MFRYWSIGPQLSSSYLPSNEATLIMLVKYLSQLILFFWTRYHIPRSWFKTSGNVLVVFEETGGDPSQIKFATRRLSGVCVHLLEEYPTIEMHSTTKGEDVNHKSKFIVQLDCPTKTHISRVKFASFGTPVGTWGSFAIGDCHDPNTNSLVEQVWNASFLCCKIFLIGSTNKVQVIVSTFILNIWWWN